jgi:hypothetical protein
VVWVAFLRSCIRDCRQRIASVNICHQYVYMFRVRLAIWERPITLRIACMKLGCRPRQIYVEIESSRPRAIGFHCRGVASDPASVKRRRQCVYVSGAVSDKNSKLRYGLCKLPAEKAPWPCALSCRDNLKWPKNGPNSAAHFFMDNGPTNVPKGEKWAKKWPKLLTNCLKMAKIQYCTKTASKSQISQYGQT